MKTTIWFDFGIDLDLPASASGCDLLASIAATIVCQQSGSRDWNQPVLAIRGDQSSGVPVAPGPRTMPVLLECLATVQSAEKTGILEEVIDQTRQRVSASRLIILSQRSFAAACKAETVDKSVVESINRWTWIDVTNDSRLIHSPAMGMTPDQKANGAAKIPDSAAETAGSR